MKQYLISGHSFLALVPASTKDEAIEKFKRKYPVLGKLISNIELAPEYEVCFLGSYDDMFDYNPE